MNQDVVTLTSVLCCPDCGSPLTMAQSGAALACRSCSRQIPIIRNIPRFIEQPADETARRTQASFGYEWTHFTDWRQSGSTNFADYFRGVDLAALGNALVLDAGCGMGRHARQIARHAGHVIAVDFSAAIDQAAANTRDVANVSCLQADLFNLPLADRAFDFAYSLGVLHHVDDTERALAGLVRKLKPGGRLRVYLYWKRHGWRGRLLSLVTIARRLTTRMPFGVLRALCWLLSVGLYVGVILPYRALTRAGIHGHESWPLFVYTRYPFQVLYNDQFDRFSAPLEKRYDPDEVRLLLERAGLRDVRVTPCFGWLGDGTRPA